MNSTVYIEFTKKSIHKKFQIVYPNNVSVKEQKISIFSPIAAAVFGRSEGDIIECILPGGKTEIKIVKIENQLKKTSI
jgi:regulator of nucleoside diphosphate kinase